MITRKEFDELVSDWAKFMEDTNAEMELIKQAVNSCTREIMATIRIRINELENKVETLSKSIIKIKKKSKSFKSNKDLVKTMPEISKELKDIIENGKIW